MHKNYFDIVMAHIEENVDKPTKEIKKEIPNLIHRHGRAFSEHFNMLTDYTLDYYIKQRRLNYAARDLVLCKDKTICEIASKYQFSDQAAFDRAIKAKYSVTPSEIRKNELLTNEECFCFDAIAGKKADTRVAKLLKSMEVGGCGWDIDFDLMLGIEQMSEEYGFDIDTCYQIADLAEKLGVPIEYFCNCCVNAMVDVQKDPLYGTCKIPPEAEFMARAGLDSVDEMDAMCEHFKCEYYELDEMKVYTYRKLMNQKK